MKYRSGLVSNSSGTSFCIYGTVMSSGEWAELLNIDPEEDDVIDVIETKSKILEGHYYDENIYVGRSFTSIDDKETGQQFKDSVRHELFKITGKRLDCSFIEEAWYNG